MRFSSPLPHWLARRRRSLYALPVSLVFIAGFLLDSAVKADGEHPSRPNPAGRETGWVLIEGAEWELGTDILYLRELPALLASHPELSELRIEEFPRHGYRIADNLTSGDAVFQAALLESRALGPLDAVGSALLHETGLSAEQFEMELDGAADYLESLLGVRPVSLAYPYHVHTRELMERLEAEGWLCARAGTPGGDGSGEPTHCFLLGWQWDERWRQSWEHWPRFEMPLHPGFFEKAVQVATSPADLSDLLYDTAA